MRTKVKQLPAPGFWDEEPSPFEPEERWERYLAMVRATDFGPQFRDFKADLLRSARSTIRQKKRWEKDAGQNGPGPACRARPAAGEPAGGVAP